MPDDDDLFDTDDQPEGKDESSSVVRSQRAHIKQLEKDLKAARKASEEVEDLRTFKAQYEQQQKATQARSVFTEAGLPDKLADLFVKVNADAEPTPEAVREFAEAYGLTPPQPADQAPAAPAVQPFAPTVGGTPPAPVQLTPDQIREIGVKNPAEALRLIAAGSLKQG